MTNPKVHSQGSRVGKKGKSTGIETGILRWNHRRDAVLLDSLAINQQANTKAKIPNVSNLFIESPDLVPFHRDDRL